MGGPNSAHTTGVFLPGTPAMFSYRGALFILGQPVLLRSSLVIRFRLLALSYRLVLEDLGG